jgi:hypothetical protein
MKMQDLLNVIVESELAQESTKDCIKHQILHKVTIGCPHSLEGCMLTTHLQFVQKTALNTKYYIK